MGLKLLHLSLHGLIRSHDLELGRDADTGGQTLYVLELVKGLAERPEVEEVQLVTRLIQDRKVSADYSQRIETISNGASIVRIPFGPKRYLRKELLWPYLDDLADNLVAKLLEDKRRPDWIHAHYADAGYVASLVSRRLNIPLVFTGHSLGREKQRRLLAAGIDHEQIEQSYSISRRIDAEELTLAHSNLVITSTRQEIDQQYGRYGNFVEKLANVVPPGVDLNRFHSKKSNKETNFIDNLLSPFLRDVDLPPFLIISRAVRRKNIPAMVEAFGRSSVLRKRHNLILVLGSRDDTRQLDKQQKDVFHQIFELVDRYDLYGKVAYPKKHKRDQIPSIYRWAANKQGLFVNPALTEPFGLTLLEAAACGLPVVATDDGGPRDILSRCNNGLLADMTDLESLQDALEQASSNDEQWRKWSDNGIEAVSRHFSWNAHVCNYLALMQKHVESVKADNLKIPFNNHKNINPFSERLLLFDLDSGLNLSEDKSFSAFRSAFLDSKNNHPNRLGVLTGRSIKAARYCYQELYLPQPVVWICRAGTEIFYNLDQNSDSLWTKLIAKDWNRDGVKFALSALEKHLVLQDDEQQSSYKVSYLLKEPGEAILPLIRKRLRQQGLAALPYLRCHWYLDVVPLRASRAEAIRYLSLRWGLALKDLYIVASQQGDAELIKGLTSVMVPMDHDQCLEGFRSHQRVFFASRPQNGLVDGLKHYRFFANK